MLTHLSIRDFAIVDRLDLDITPGMTVMTGETGAGKSIMLDALGLTLGDRADCHAIRAGEKRADISASFDLYNCPDALKWLQDHELDNGDSCILRRVITREGRSRGYINGTPCPLSDLKQIGEQLIDIHSQHEHQSLLQKDTHRRLLDNCANARKQAEIVMNAWRQWSECQSQLKQLVEASQQQSAQQQLLGYQLQEFEALALGENELESLEVEQRQLASAGTVLHACHQTLNLCREDDSSAIQVLQQAQRLLEESDNNHPSFSNARDMLTTALIQVEEAATELNHFADSFDADPQRQMEVEARLSVIYDLARKHRVQPDELYLFQQRLQQQLNSFSQHDELIEQMQAELVQLESDWRNVAEKLSKTRKRAALKLEKDISRHMRGLGMPNGRFEIHLSSDEISKPSPHGLEQVEFLVTSNPGQPPAPLQKVASGGELSRISLAIQVIAARTSRTPTLVFDEVDVGISGGTAEVVGRLLRDIGETGQVLCVTHQPQVASQGHQHLFIRKKQTKNSTRTEIKPLTSDQRISEVARMLGGQTLTEKTLNHAREMLELAQGDIALSA
ncbi:DNA repair protein RecN [Endozoicomonadaceae bacterium StTr2]